MAIAENSTPKQRGRPFAKGVSGNPAGKPKGAQNHATRAAKALLQGNLSAIVQSLIDAALSGDVSAQKIVIDKILPNAKELPISADLPQVDNAASLPKLSAAILQAVSTGQLTPSEGQALSTLAVHHARSIELADFEARLSALEEKKIEHR